MSKAVQVTAEEVPGHPAAALAGNAELADYEQRELTLCREQLRQSDAECVHLRGVLDAHGVKA